MEFATKKKRKTRKCLDEIRKRSRRSTIPGVSLVKTSQQREKIKTDKYPAPSQRLITNNRLTLNMFSNVVRSETITRPLLEEIKQSNYQGCDKNHNNYTKLSDNVCFGQCNSSNNSMPLFNLEADTLQEHVGSPLGVHATDSPNLQSPAHVNISESLAELMPKFCPSSTTSLSSETSDEDRGVSLYEELMNKISSHLNKVTSALIKEDVMKNSKCNLKKLYNKCWSQEYQMSDQEKDFNSSETPIVSPQDSIAIVQNPLDYIKLKHWQQFKYGDVDCHLGLSEKHRSLLPAEVPAVTALQSPALSFKSECTGNVTLYDTPEYNYYPHRLN